MLTRIQAEAVSHALGAPVLSHRAKKPTRACARAVREYLGAQSAPVVVGDRLLTDVVLANALGGLAVLTTRLWAPRDARLLRLLERGLLRLVGVRPDVPEDVRACVRRDEEGEAEMRRAEEEWRRDLSWFPTLVKPGSELESQEAAEREQGDVRERAARWFPILGRAEDGEKRQ